MKRQLEPVNEQKEKASTATTSIFVLHLQIITELFYSIQSHTKFDLNNTGAYETAMVE